MKVKWEEKSWKVTSDFQHLPLLTSVSLHIHIHTAYSLLAPSPLLQFQGWKQIPLLSTWVPTVSMPKFCHLCKPTSTSHTHNSVHPPFFFTLTVLFITLHTAHTHPTVNTNLGSNLVVQQVFLLLIFHFCVHISHRKTLKGHWWK